MQQTRRPVDRAIRVRRVAPFAFAGVLAWALVPLHNGSLKPGLLIVAAALSVLLLVAVFFAPWERLPDWLRVAPPLVYIVVIALMREGGGGLTSGYNPLYLLPVFWLALYGTLRRLAVGLVVYALAQLSWVVLHGTRQVTVAVLSTVVTSIICFAGEALVRRSREYVADLEAIRELPQRLATEERPEVLRSTLCQSTIELCGGCVAILYQGRDGTDLRPVAGCSADGSLEDVSAATVTRAATEAVRTGRPVFVADVPAEVDVDARAPELSGVGSALWSPAVREGSARGVLMVGWSEHLRAPALRASTVMQILSAEATLVLELSDRLALRAQQLAELRELDRLKTDFVSSASHELRTPITSIRGYLDILLEGEAGDMPEEQRTYLEVVDRNAHRLQTLVGDLLVVSRIESGRLQLSVRETDLMAVAARVRDTIAPTLEQQDVELKLRGPDRVVLPVDERRIEQVLTNIISNAVKFSHAGEPVTVDVQDESDGARVVVCDTGIGMSQQDLGHLFEKFFRASSATESGIPGTGLGLAICKGIVDAHGGRISVDSALGEGTTVDVYIPRVRG